MGWLAASPRGPARVGVIASAVVATLLQITIAWGQQSIYEVEPNDTPAEATEVSGEAVLIGTMGGSDQDAYRWTVSDVDAQKRWTFNLEGIPGRLTVVEVIRVEYADNGVDVAAKRQLFKMGTRDGLTPSVHEDLLFEPGEYILGVASGGGERDFRPPVDSIGFNKGDSSDPAEGSEPGAYRLAIREGSRIVVEATSRDRSTRKAASILRLGRESAAYVESPEAWYELDVGSKDAGQLWEVAGQVPVGRRVRATLRAGDGSKLATADSDSSGKFRLTDLGLQAGRYTIVLEGDEGGFIRAVGSAPVGQRIEGAEAEPNDTWRLANRVDLSQPVTGRMGTRGEDDYFQFSLDSETADQVLALRLGTDASDRFTFALLDSKGAVLQTRLAEGPIELPDLVLGPGTWGVRVARGPEGAEYSVTLSTQGAIEAGIEAEPNDTILLAAGVPANNRIKGRFSGRDTDFFKFLITEKPQLWRFQVIGDGVQELAFHDGAGIQTQDHNVPRGERRVRLDNVFLLPGTHYVRVSGEDGGSYTLLARPIGPPDPNGEREPNDDATRMQLLRFGQTRTGLLPDKADVDYYRFHLANRDRIRLAIQPPPDGEIQAELLWDSISFKKINRPQAGQTIEFEGLYLPGDYQLKLSTRKPSDGEYSLSLERLERFGCPKDCEPNDNLDFANPWPPDNLVEGRSLDEDWYELPVFDRPTEIVIASDVQRNLRVVPRGYSVDSVVDWNHETKLYRGTIPAGIQMYLEVRPQQKSDYRLEVSFPGGPQAKGVSPPPLDLDLTIETDRVAAYRRVAQLLSGELTLTNRSEFPVDVRIDAATSDYRWRVDLERNTATVPGGGGSSVPFILKVPADAWADRPVRASLRARTENGAHVEAFAEVIPDRGIDPINPVRGWALPDELLGGFNVAWSALGGRWTGEEDSAVGTGFPYLFDGMAVDEQGVHLRGGTKVETINVDVELAGPDPVEVAGVVLNLVSARWAKQFLGNVDLALSTDGREFTPVVSDRLLPIRDEQAFVLSEPVPARFARLQLKHAFDGAAKPQIRFGELKVIAKPGIDISGGHGFNLADPKLGGHVVWSRPTMSAAGWDTTVLEPGDDARRLRFRGRRQDIVIGFHHDRAAQISRIEWLGATGSGQPFVRAEVATSTESPIGPWRALGEIELSGTSSPAVLRLERPTWARFVKLSALREADSGVTLAPLEIRIWERPTEGEYRSVLTEWGWASQAAIYEQLTPIAADEELAVAGNTSRATAQLLPLGKRVRGKVKLGRQEHWYGVVVPEGENTLTVALGGDPTVRTRVRLEDADGEPVPARDVTGASTPDRHLYEAVVEPGETYYLRVEEPPRNVVFIWDTSASVGAYLPVIYSSLISYAGDLVPGRDAANLMPFGGQLLLRDWYGEPYVLQTVINDYPRKESSSAAERTLAKATEALAPRTGTKAVVVITDAATNYYPDVWDDLDEVQPRVFGLGLSSSGALSRNPPREQDLMQDWSRVNGGLYTFVKSEGEMEIAFDRVATLLRRPAPYTLEATSEFREAPGPGSLKVVSGGAGGATGSDAVELILDASGSMLQRLEGTRRIEIAKDVLIDAVSRQIPAGTPVALRVFGHRQANACRTDLEIPLAVLDPAAAADTIRSIRAMNLAKTPIADSLAKVESDLKAAKGRKVVVLVTDGEETCDGKPDEVIQKLQDRGIDVTLNIVGFAIDDTELEATFKSWAELGGGRYLSAADQQGLSDALRSALQLPYAVYDSAGTRVGEGVVDGEPLELEQGFYRVVVETSPPRTFAKVEIPGEQDVVVELEDGR